MRALMQAPCDNGADASAGAGACAGAGADATGAAESATAATAGRSSSRTPHGATPGRVARGNLSGDVRKKRNKKKKHRKEVARKHGGGATDSGSCGPRSAPCIGVKGQPLCWTSPEVYGLLGGRGQQMGSVILKAIAAMNDALRRFNLTYSCQSKALVHIDVSTVITV